MTTGAAVSVVDGNLIVEGTTKILSSVYDNVFLSPAGDDETINGAFIGVGSDRTGSHRVFPIGKLEGLRFMCVFRFKLWWMTQRIGSVGRDIPFETQFLIVEGKEMGSTAGKEPGVTYCVFLPVLEGSFRAVLQGNEEDELEICLESGDPAVGKFEGSHLVFVAAGKDPFDVITNSVKAVEKHLQTFTHRERKKIPDMINWFGWCTWDAFYTEVTADGVRQGLQSFKKGGIPPGFIIIDDGWQSVDMDPSGVHIGSDNSANFANRLTHIKENHKFQRNSEGRREEEEAAAGLADVVADIKKTHDLKYVYVWHAITGYWGGVRPGVREMEPYEPAMAYPVSSPGVKSNESCSALDCMKSNGLGLVHPEKVFTFYDELHSYLAAAGVDGVKVDVQNVLETVGAGHGGRVELARKYHQALEASVSRNFPDNGIISCMSHNTDGLYSAKKTAVIRASDDFWPRDAASHTIHVASVAYNTVFLGEFMQPDWDMFQSLHPMAEYHAAARAVGGCAVYVSDKPGNHDFKLLRKLVLPDGSILRAKLPGRPTKDCLFSDPTRDGTSFLKIWNLNEHTGVIGVFHCQGAGWCKHGKTNLIHDYDPSPVSAAVRAADVEHLPKIAAASWNGDAVLFSHSAGELVYLRKDTSLPVTLNPREYEVFTVAPVEKLPGGVAFAAIGLPKMFNAGGAVKGLKLVEEGVEIKARGCGTFGCYASARPTKVTVDSAEEEFEYDQGSGFLKLELEIPKEELYQWSIKVDFF